MAAWLQHILWESPLWAEALASFALALFDPAEYAVKVGHFCSRNGCVRLEAERR